MILHSQVTFSRSKMSSQEEGDYVDMTGLVFTYLPLHFKQRHFVASIL